VSGGWVSADSGAVDSNVNAAESFHRLLNSSVDRCLVCDVDIEDFNLDPWIFIPEFLTSALEESQV
jgi:hypothetical protein